MHGRAETRTGGEQVQQSVAELIPPGTWGHPDRGPSFKSQGLKSPGPGVGADMHTESHSSDVSLKESA